MELSKELLANKHNHINGIENFWNQAKRHIGKFNALPRQHFNIFLKSPEWRFNMEPSKRALGRLKKFAERTLLGVSPLF